MNKHLQSGQVLLIVVLLLATTLTIVMTVVFTSRTETQVSKLQQDADRSLAAAEAGIEAAIRSQQAQTTRSFTDLGLVNLQGIDLAGSTVEVRNDQTGEFVSPVISRDQQYTLYLATYNSVTGTFGPSSVNGSFYLYYGTGTDTATCANIALEITVIGINSSGDISSSKYVADVGMPKILGIEGVQIGENAPSGKIIDGVHFICQVAFTGQNELTPLQAKLLFVRVIGSGASTRIGVEDTDLPAQGRYIYSEAKTKTGLTKKIQLFESYPQLPAEFFVTSFGAITDS